MDTTHYKELLPDDILSFGKEKGYSLKQIYQFNPKYIEEFLIQYTEFYIDVEKFKHIATLERYIEPKPDPTMIEKFEQLAKPIHGVAHAIKHLTNGGVLINFRFEFSKKALEIIEQKKKGDYIKPKWNKAESWDASTFLKAERPKWAKKKEEK